MIEYLSQTPREIILGSMYSYDFPLCIRVLALSHLGSFITLDRFLRKLDNDIVRLQ
jgi:hypothetical protein